MADNIKKCASSKRRKYVVGFTVHEAKGLSKSGTAVDPLVVVRALGREFKTSKKTGKLQHVKFEEGDIWNDLKLNADEFSMTYIEFELQAANVIFRNDVLGSNKIQLAMVQKRPNHCYSMKWLQLSQGTDLTAKMKVTVFCYAEGDTPPRPEDIENCPDEVEAQLASLNAAVLEGEGQGGHGEDSLNRSAYHLFIHVHRAEDLGGGIEQYDPYIQVDFNGFELRTEPGCATHTINFDECFRIPVTTPLFADSIVIRIWDGRASYQQGFQDQVIVQGRLSFSLLRMHAMTPKWFNFYGFNKEEVGDLDSLVALGEQLEENHYLGRVLISGRVQKLKSLSDLLNPRSGVTGQAFEDPPTSNVSLLMDVFEVSGCPGAEVVVELTVGNKRSRTKAAKRNPDKSPEDATLGGFFKFKQSKGRAPAVGCLMATESSNQLDLMLNVYANLQDSALVAGGWQRVGFKRLKLKDIQRWTDKVGAPRWISCRPMIHLPSSIDPGQVLVSLAWTDEVVEQINRSEPGKFKEIDFTLRTYVLMARNLKTHRHEMPSAFVQVHCADQTLRTNTRPDTSNPIFEEVVEMNIKLQASVLTSRVFPEPIQITVYDDIAHKEGDAPDEAYARKPTHGAKEAVQPDRWKMAQRKMWNRLNDAQDLAFATVVGDVTAAKRYGAVIGGKQLIGRTVVKYHRILRPPLRDDRVMRPKWVKLKGGYIGGEDSGDILIGMQLMKKRHAKNIPAPPPRPHGTECLLSVALLGLRHVAPHYGEEVNRPTLRIMVPQPAQGSAAFTDVTFSPDPTNRLGPDDSNRQWEADGRKGFEFLELRHLPVTLATETYWESMVRFRLFGDGHTPVPQLEQVDLEDIEGGDSSFLGEGVMSLADQIPWISRKCLSKMRALEEYEHDPDEIEVDNVEVEGVPVSDSEGSAKTYITVEIGKEPVTSKITFNANDSKNYPPKITWIDDQFAEDNHLGIGDWLIAYKTPAEPQPAPCAHWTPAQAAQFLDQSDQKRIRPLVLKFRRKPDEKQMECAVRIVTGPLHLLFKHDDEIHPPQIEKDTSKDKMWKKAGVQPKWRVVDVNGISTEELHFNHPVFQKLIDMRPAIFLCRAFGKVANIAEENKRQDEFPVRLCGTPNKYVKERDKKLNIQDGSLKYSRCPRPTPHLPPVNSQRHMISRVARGALLDVRGIVRSLHGSNEDEDETKLRPAVQGKLEDCIPRSTFAAVPIYSGSDVVATAKVRVKVITPVIEDWYTRKEFKDAIDGLVFDPQHFRKRYKIQLPQLVRVRTYIIRGLNVSGAVAGQGNPYPFFQYGNCAPLMRPEKRRMNEVDPRLYITEERDVRLPEEARFEVGLFDFAEGGTDLLIGRTIVDLEDRWYNLTYQEYMRINKVPIEYRPLEQQDEAALCKGSLEMWLEIVDSTRAAEVPASALQEPPCIEVEVRLVVWNAKQVSRRLCVDDIGEERPRVDVLCRCALDSRSYKGPQPGNQETDIHYACVEEAEYNWRFVWSRVQVTKGVPLDCFLQLAIWETFATARPVLMCEALIDIKNYCKKVANTGTMIQLESDIPLTNPKLTQLLKEEMKEANGGVEFDDEDAAANDADDADGALHGGQRLPPAATMKVMLQVLNQSEAAMPANKAGLGRGDPNQKPTVTFPKTGRDWKATLPAAAAFVEAMEGLGGGGRCKLLVFLAVLVSVFAFLNTTPGEAGCTALQDSCKLKCASCGTCSEARIKSLASDPGFVSPSNEDFCYYKWQAGFPGGCASNAAFKEICNVKDGLKCTASDGNQCAVGGDEANATAAADTAADATAATG
eukprot:TRINITY_DN8424_c0_g1_i1.p1 TRINITY_DN8424_c0_g1~~TRINITY_DN8424_c0_g1_i1.p1  ORF type:complete len:1795 (-),score=350.07 TRINITY_DN8424_c0_g1_i1:408-5792(-)